jgi:parallel beta-helix repeat protein
MLIATVLVSCLLVVATVEGATNVGGTLASDATWTKAGSPYLLVSSLSVPLGVTLTIEAGVTVDLYYYNLNVGGSLQAVGTKDEPVIFSSGTSAWSTPRVYFQSGSTPWNASTGSGCNIDHAVFNGASLYVSGCSPKVSNSYFTNLQNAALYNNNGSPLIVNNAFDISNYAIYTNGGNPVISKNFIKATTGIYAGNNAYISDNNITGCSNGILLYGYDVTIERNLFTGNSYGILAGQSTSLIQNNTFSQNTIGISGGGIIVNNTIANNGQGIRLLVSASTVTQNNIYSNSQYNFNLALSVNVNVSSNWWGTVNAAAINASIYDYKNDPNFGNATFTRYLTQHVATAPALESVNWLPNPTPTSIPTPNPTSYPVITPQPTTPPESNNQQAAAPASTPKPTPEPTATPTPKPTPAPTATHESALTLGDTLQDQLLTQLDLLELAKLVLLGLGLMWVLVISVAAVRAATKKYVHFYLFQICLLSWLIFKANF